MSASTRRPARLGCDLLEARDTPTATAITADFNRSPIPTGDTLWFASAGHVNHLPTDPSTLRVNGGSVSFTAAGQAYTVAVPAATINFSPAVTTATVNYTADGWVVTAPRKFNGDIFLGGAALPVATDLPGGIKNVQWSTNITADAGAPRVRWHWGAAVYQANFGSLSGLAVKAVDDKKVDFYKNADPAGTPEAFKAALVRGGTGDGRKEYAGGETRSRTVAPDATPVSSAGSLSGTIFQDADGDRVISGGDLGYGGIEVDLFDAGGNLVASTTTADDGTYSFDLLAAGTYAIQMVLTDPSQNVMGPQVGTSGGQVDQFMAGFTGIQVNGTTGTGYNLGVWFSFS